MSQSENKQNGSPAVNETDAIAVLPYEERFEQGLDRVALDDLHWPLGRPDRLGSGTVADMLPTDHLLTYPKTKLYWSRKVPPRLSLMIVEPDVIHKKHLLLARLFQWRFHCILTKNADLLRICPKARFFFYGGTQLQSPESVDSRKSEMCSLIASNRRLLQGHRLRHDVVEEVRKRKLDVEIMGRAYRPFDHKEAGLAPFRYTVAIENIQEPRYFTEKIVDACLCRTVPIYWGAPDIGHYFDLDGVIVCQTRDEICNAIARVSAEDYVKRKTAIENNFRRALTYTDVERRAALAVLEVDAP